MTDQQQPAPKEQLISLLNSCMAAAQSRDGNLIGFSTGALENFLDAYELVPVKLEEGEES